MGWLQGTFLFFFIFIYLFMYVHQVLAVAAGSSIFIATCRIFSCLACELLVVACGNLGFEPGPLRQEHKS